MQPSTQNLITIVIVENHELFAAGLASILSKYSNCQVVGMVGSKRELINFLEINVDVDIVLMDLNLGKEDGVDIIGDLKAAGYPQKMIALSTYRSPRILSKLKKAGANGYIQKDVPIEDLVHAIETINNGKDYYDRVKEAGTDELKINYPDDFIRKHELTTREYEVFIYLAKSYSTKEIASILFLSENTVSTYRKYIKAKLKLRTTAEIVRFAFENELI